METSNEQPDGQRLNNTLNAVMNHQFADLISFIQTSVDKEYNSFEPDNQSAHWHKGKEILKLLGYSGPKEEF